LPPRADAWHDPQCKIIIPIPAAQRTYTHTRIPIAIAYLIDDKSSPIHH
jgi:hypothetical protein